MNNKGLTFVYVSFIMSLVFLILSVIWKMGINDIELSKDINNNSKSYYVAEAGIYYGGSAILEAVQSLNEPASSITVTNPFNEYNGEHSFILTITKVGTDYRILSQGVYKNKINKIEALVSIVGEEIIYNQMRKIS